MSMQTFIENLKTFISDSPTSFHAAAASGAILKKAGFQELNRQDAIPTAAGGYYFINNGAVMAWYIPSSLDPNSHVEDRKLPEFRIVGTHMDSPGFKLKPLADISGPGEFQQLGMETYGGLLPNSWLDRDLGLAGKLISKSGKSALIKTGPICRIPQLAIHLDRSAGEKLTLDRQKHLQPIWSVGNPDLKIFDYLRKFTDWDAAEEISGFEIFTYDTQPPTNLGADQEFLASGRQDNLLSSYAALIALVEAANDAKECAGIMVWAGFDHEEVGSNTPTGAAGPVLEDILERIAHQYGANREIFRRILAASSCLSLDVAHSIHPNYCEKHDPDTHPRLGNGPVLKLNSDQRYATDAEAMYIWNRTATAAGVPTQVFVSNNTSPCGSTIGPITATRLGITTVDAGVPILSMHSAREMCHNRDQIAMKKLLKTYFLGA